MNAGIHKLTAGGGYLYLVREIAAADDTHRGRASLADYYSSKGESPGRWVGRGLASLGQPVGRELVTDKARELWRVAVGSVVTEDQMKALFGLGMHPNAAQIAEHLISQGAPKVAGLAAGKLGRPFQIRDGATELQRRLAVAFRDHNLIRGQHWSEPIDDEVQAQIRTKIARELFSKEYGREPADDRELSGFIARESREPTTSVAGYDLRFTPPKSVSVLWALAPLDVAKVIEECHERAIADALEYLQEHAAFTRTGAGGVAQIDTEGFIAAAFVHRDSRAGDPHLHTHVPISNKVRGVGADGIPRWLALDGRPLYKATVAASELYDTQRETYLIEALGLSFVERAPLGHGTRPVREVAGIPVDLIEMFSSGLRAIDDRYADLAKQFHAKHGREPTTKESIDLYERAHLDTRNPKHEPRSLAEQRGQWRGQAVEHLGGMAELGAMLGRLLSGRQQTARQITPKWIKKQAAAVVETVAQNRSVWQRTHVFAEAQRRVRAADAHAGARAAERITETALRDHSIAHARDLDADLAEPSVLRRRDGSSVYSTHGTQLYTSAAVLAAEQRILAAARRTDGRRVGEQAVGLTLLEQHANGRNLNAGQEALVRQMACSGARVGLALAPAGTGKTTAMAALARVWQEERGHVVGLASSANAAQLLRNDMAGQGVHIDVDTVDKLVWLRRNPEARNDPARSWFDRIGRNTLIVVDEAGKSGTLALDEVIAHALARGASVRLVGDDKQLSSISAGGILTDIANTVGAVTLTEVMRFSSRAEAAATLALREGDPSALAFYADHHRIHVASDQTAADMAFARWLEDRAKDWDSVLLAPTNETVKELNERARLHRLEGAAGGAEAALSDGLRASEGDIITTRKNWRGLRLRGGRDYVRNGHRWRVSKVHRNGALTVAHVGGRHEVTLPAKYVTKHTTLGYASTIDAAQGDTIGSRHRPGTCHVVGSDTLSRQQVYTAMSRGVSENHIYLSTAESDPHRILAPKATHPDTAIDVLSRALARDDAQVSATTAERESRDPFRRLAPAAARYLDAVGQAAESEVDPAVLAQIDRAGTVHPGLTSEPAWPVLRKHLAILALAGDDPLERLAEAKDTRELDTAHDAAAVLDWRLDYSGAHSAGIGPLRWLPDLPGGLNEHQVWGEYLRARSDLVSGLADEIRGTVQGWTRSAAPAWARPLLATSRGLTAEIAVFRAAVGVDDADSRLTGPTQYPVRARAVQRALEDKAQEVLGKHQDFNLRRWNQLVDEINPRIRRDQYWTALAAQLTEIARTGVDVHQLVADAAAQGPLPDELPAAALWWRIFGTVSPATLESGSQRLRPVWLAHLHAVFGTALAETIAADPAFPGLVAAVGAADAARWTARDLLQVAFEHLRDVAAVLRPDEYARLMTYSIELFTTPNPFDRDVPVPAEPPLAVEEEEELAHEDPQQQVVGDDEFLADLGFASEITEDPLDIAADTELAGLTFDDLSTERPVRHPLQPALASVAALRSAYQQAEADVASLDTQIRQWRGPAVLAARSRILELRARADADRPYMIAVNDVVAAWDEAEAEYEEALRLLEWARDELAAVEADAGADPLDVASAGAGLRLAMMQLPETTPAQRFQAQLADAVAARATVAGGADKIVTSADVDAARLEADDADRKSLRAAMTRRNELRIQLDRAENEAARAFAEAQTRNADHIIEHREELVTELAVLDAAAGRTLAGSITLPPDATEHLEPLAARAISLLAKTDRTLTAVQAGDDRQALEAMSVLHSAAAAQDRKVMWCAPTAELAERARGADVADTVVAVDDARERFSAGSWRLPADSILVVDHAADVEPGVIAELAEHADENRARVLLLDPGEQRWPPRPSSALLRLLHQDLPWSVTLSVGSATPARRVHQPDLDPVLDQAARFDRSLLPDDIVGALEQRYWMRVDRAEAQEIEEHGLWRSESRKRSRDNGLEL